MRKMPLGSLALPQNAMIDCVQRRNSQFSILSFHTDSCSRLLYEKVWHHADASITNMASRCIGYRLHNLNKHTTYKTMDYQS